jgi:hypothetical protein
MTCEHPLPPRQVGRRALLALAAAIPVAVLASPAHALAPSPALLDALKDLESSRTALDVAARGSKAAMATVDQWEIDNPPPKSKKGRRRWEKRSSAIYHTLTDEPWQAMMTAEVEFRAAQDALAAIECTGPADLQLMAKAAVTYDAIELHSTNRAPISLAVARCLEGRA